MSSFLKWDLSSILLLFFKNLFLERGEGREKEGEKHRCVVASYVPPTGDLAHNPGMCPDWESTGDPLVHRPVLNPLSHTSQVPFINWIVCLPGMESCEYFMYFGDQTLARCIIGKYVFPYSWFPFYLLMFSLGMQKHFILMWSHLFILSFMSLALWDILVKI